MAEDSGTKPTSDLVAFAQACYRADRDAHDEWRDEARQNYDMVAGNQWNDDDKHSLEDTGKVPVVFNHIARIVNALCGTQVNNRQETRFLPREQGDVQTNEILTGAAEWVRDEGDVEDEETDAFEDMIITGMGWTETRMDYERDPDGLILVDRNDPLEMGWDPSSRKKNLGDARWVFRIKSYMPDSFEQEFPDADMELSTSMWDSDKDDEGHTRTHVYPQDAYNAQQGKAGVNEQKAIKVMQLQWSEKTDVYRVGDSAERMDSETYNKLKDRFAKEGIKVVKQKGLIWKQAFIAGGEVLGDPMPCPYPDGPTMKCMTYRRDRNKRIWYGVVRATIDPQKFGNKFFSQILDILNKGAKGGLMVEEDATSNMQQLEENWASSDAVHKFNPGALSQGKVLPKPPVQVPPDMGNLMEYSMRGVDEVTGINLEFLGMADRNQPGVLEAQRKQSGLTIIAPLFDAMRRYRKEAGRVMLYFINTHISDDRLIRIMGENGMEQYVPLTKQANARYDVIVDESPTSPNMKEKVFGAMVQMMPAIQNMGIPIPPDVLEFSPLPSLLVQKWQKYIEEKQAGQIPPEVEQQIEQGKQELERLGQENVQLKDKTAEKQADQALKAEELKQKKLDAEQERLADYDIERKKLEDQFTLRQQEIEEKYRLERHAKTMEARSQGIVGEDDEAMIEEVMERMLEMMAQSQEQMTQAVSMLAEASQSQAQSAAMMAEASMAEKEVVYDEAGTPLSIRPAARAIQ